MSQVQTPRGQIDAILREHLGNAAEPELLPEWRIVKAQINDLLDDWEEEGAL